MSKVLHITIIDWHKTLCGVNECNAAMWQYESQPDISVYVDSTNDRFTEWCEACLNSPEFALHYLAKEYA